MIDGYFLTGEEVALLAAWAPLIRGRFHRDGLPVPATLDVLLAGLVERAARARATAGAAVTQQVPAGSAQVPIMAPVGSEPPPSWWLSKRAAAELGVTPRAVVKAIEAGSVVARRGRDGAWRLSPESVREYGERRRRGRGVDQRPAA